MIVVSTAEELRDALCAHDTVRLVGLDTKAAFRPIPAATAVRVASSGIVEHFVDDQVVVARGGTPLAELQAALAERGQTLPYPTDLGALAAGLPGTLAGSISMNLPHALEAQCGSWRDWVLGMTAMLGDGTVFKCGSKAVKNVAGYDLQKLMIGARGSLGVLLGVTLRTFPLRAVPVARCVGSGDGEAAFIQRVLHTDFDRAADAAGGDLVLADPASATLWCSKPPMRFDGDWVIAPGAARIEDPTLARLMRRTKGLFDPAGKLNPGEFDLR